jgi:Fur family ferric uptake transcriptional regulator
MTTPGRSSPAAPETEDEALARLRAQGGRITRARRELVAYFFANDEGVTAEDIIGHFPDVDAATVYRSLASLEQAGIVEHTHLGHGPATWVRAGLFAVPVVCEQCGAVVHVPRDEFTTLGERLLAGYGFTVDLHHFAMTGRCQRCTTGRRKRPTKT